MSRFSVTRGRSGGWSVIDNVAGSENAGLPILTFTTRPDAEQVAYVKNAIAAGELTQEDISEALKPKKRWYVKFGTGDIYDSDYDAHVVTVYDDGYDEGDENPLEVILDALNKELP